MENNNSGKKNVDTNHRIQTKPGLSGEEYSLFKPGAMFNNDIYKAEN